MSGKLNKEEQVQVVIRLKPTEVDSQHPNSVYLSEEQDKTLVVQTPNKKEFFVFDNIADQHCTQQDLYHFIGQDAVKSSTNGFNCCIFAYGQTGAGKTYSILGDTHTLATDYYCQDRGILPRLLADIFSCCDGEADKYWVKCSYMEIYNEQIFDLLNSDKKPKQIREDFKKGVFVDGLFEENVTNYEEAMTILLKGIKNRKISATSMNDESSRSHTIFTTYIETEFKQGDSLKVRKSKIHIVDLAGSERAKQTKVEGDRLKEGCNINKSLHVLGNVINALVESSKRKKHIPFRDSKLTHFLKDSLCGNSITKLLANIHPSKTYLGDTLSTLMFAKRAKILKMKIQVNENFTQNFEDLRKQIRKLREQLAEARYIKNQSKMVERNITESDNDINNFQKIIDISSYDAIKNESALQIFEENQTNYKALIEIYEEHYKVCTQSNQSNKNRKNVNIHQEWKNLEKKNQAYQNLMKNIPAFTKIFKENISLKSEILEVKKDGQAKPRFQVEKNESLSICIGEISQIKEKELEKQKQIQIQELKKQYSNLLQNIEQKFTSYISEIQEAYEELQNDNKQKQQRIKDLRKRKELPPELEDLINQNQYLKLNIMQLEDEINSYEEKERKHHIEIKELRKERNYHSEGEIEVIQGEGGIVNKLGNIRECLEKEVVELEKERNEMIDVIQALRERVVALSGESKAYADTAESLKLENRSLKRKLNEILKIEEVEISNTFWTNEESNFSEDLELFRSPASEDKPKVQASALLEKEQALRQKLEKQVEEERQKAAELSSQIIALHQTYNEEIDQLKARLKKHEYEERELISRNSQLLEKINRISEPQNSSAYSFKEIGEKQDAPGNLHHVKSQKTLSRVKEPQYHKQLNRVRKGGERDETLRKKTSVGSLHKVATLKIKEQEPPRKGTL